MKFNYDKLNDLLYAYKEGSNVYSNIVIGEFHLEINREGDIIGVEILHASDILNEYDVPKKMLEQLDNVTLKVVQRNNSLLVFLILHSAKEEKTATITTSNLEAPLLQEITTES